MQWGANSFKIKWGGALEVRIVYGATSTVAAFVYRVYIVRVIILFENLPSNNTSIKLSWQYSTNIIFGISSFLDPNINPDFDHTSFRAWTACRWNLHRSTQMTTGRKKDTYQVSILTNSTKAVRYQRGGSSLQLELVHVALSSRMNWRRVIPE